MSDLYQTGIRPVIDDYLLKESEKVRDYGNYWSASSAGYCMRKLFFERLGVPPISKDARKQRVFSSGHIFHDWIQELTREAGLSIAQEVELQDEELMVRGHFDDLVLVKEKDYEADLKVEFETDHLILYDYKTQNSRAFSYKRPNMSHYHKMQLGTYMYMLRKWAPPYIANPETGEVRPLEPKSELAKYDLTGLTEARILKISKDDLRMSEEQLLWSEELRLEVKGFWDLLNQYWKDRKIPPCTCADYEGGFMASPKYNPFYLGEPCSIDYLKECVKQGLVTLEKEKENV